MWRNIRKPKWPQKIINIQSELCNIFVLFFSVQPVYKGIVARFKSLSENELRRLSVEEKFAFSIERLPRGKFIVPKLLKHIMAN